MGILLPLALRSFVLIVRRRVTLSKNVVFAPQNHQDQAFHTSVIVLPVATSVAHYSPSAACSVPAPLAPDYCTPEMVQ
ncbi:hypothetical protein CK203_044423 [Vitis vinifera]|uniref:Secreted protein n=1 Tax=Vitis vinifera TaxID=29760 RepID=A0A438HUF6_VITVI|nr:hypothetical protein CK203_044423 [Vitis vinifera]